MKKFLVITLVVFLLLTTYFIPLTSAKADVNWGESNEIFLDDTSYSLFRKLATLESLGNLTIDGVTSYSISNVNSLDEYIDDLLNQIDYALNDVNIDNVFDGMAWTQIDEWNEYINRKAYDLAYQYQMPNVSSDLLSDWFNLGLDYKVEYKPNNLSLYGLRGLSRFNQSEDNPTIPNDIQIYIDIINKRDYNDVRTFWFWETQPNTSAYTDGIFVADRTWFTPGNNNMSLNSRDNTLLCFKNQIQNINIYSIDDTYYCNFNWSNDSIRSNSYGGTFWWGRTPNTSNGHDYLQYRTSSSNYSLNFSHSGSLNQIFNALKDKVKNVNIYVDGVAWATVGETTQQTPTLDIDGLLKLYGNDNPIEYYIPQGTQIDYQKLYEVIYNAILNASPVTQQTINNNNTYYYNNNYYSPTIINNYGSDGEGSEEDFIDSLLTWAVIPEFDTALLVPLEEPLLNGEKIFITSVQVFPNDILMVIGAAFVLILFAAFINRLIE